MPWIIVPIDEKFCVISVLDQSSLGCHDDMELAETQLAELLTDEPEVEVIEETPIEIEVSEEGEDKQDGFDDSPWDGSAERWDTADAFCEDSLIDVNPDGEDKIKGLCKLPFRDPGATNPNINALRAIGGSRGFSAIEKPADTSQEEWDSKVIAAAKRVVNWWTDAFDDDAPESVFSAAGETKPTEAESSFPKTLVDAAKSIVKFFERDKSKLKKEYDFLNFEFKGNSGIAVKEVNGKPWHITYSTNSFVDRDNEFFSTRALENYVKENEEKENKGFFNLWHINENRGGANTDFAIKEWQGVIGRFLVEAGPYLQDKKGQSAMTFFKEYPDSHSEIAPEGWGCSPEFKFLPEDKETGTYEWIWITKTSTLPRGNAANIHTKASQKGSELMALSDDQRKAAEKVFGKEEFAATESQAEKTSQELEDTGLAYKETEQPKDIEIPIDEIAKAVSEQFSIDFKSFADGMAVLGQEIVDLGKRVDRLAETKAIKETTETPRFVWTLQQSKANEALVTESDELAKGGPVETAATSTPQDTFSRQMFSNGKH